jgi:hypothetical protein
MDDGPPPGREGPDGGRQDDSRDRGGGAYRSERESYAIQDPKVYIVQVGKQPS